MSLYVLDTDIVTLHQHNLPQVVAKIQACAPDELAVTVVTVEEQMRGRLAQIGRPRVDLALAHDQLRINTTSRRSGGEVVQLRWNSDFSSIQSCC